MSDAKEWWYETRSYGGPIVPVMVEWRTENSVWIGGNRRLRMTSWSCVFPTWSEAKEHLLKEAERKVQSARRALELANGRLGNIKGLSPPEPQTQEPPNE